MKATKSIFWNVDTQFDFVSPKGKLYVTDAEMLLSTWKEITDFAEHESIKVINTADWHHSNSSELSGSPDFIKSFPEHCMADTLGAQFVNETNPENPLIIDWDRDIQLDRKLIRGNRFRNFILRKDAFDVFKGNPYTGNIVDILSPKIVIVYGVTTNVCVNDAVLGLVKRVPKVVVVEDAVKELPNIPLPFENWKKLGVELIYSYEIERLF